MTYFNSTRQMLICIALIIQYCFGAAYQSTAEELASTLSGQITDVKDEPVPNVSVVLLYVENDEGGVNPVYHSSFYPFLTQLPMRHNARVPNEQELQRLPPYLESKSDGEGRFTFRDISAKTAQLLVLPEIPPGKRCIVKNYKKGQSGLFQKFSPFSSEKCLFSHINSHLFHHLVL